MKNSRILVLLLCTLCVGCGGRIFTDQTVPLTTNFHNTPVATGDGEGDVKHFQLRPYLDLQWDQNAIGEIAKKKGMDKVYYADIHTFSILGIWNQYTVHVYGK